MEVIGFLINDKCISNIFQTKKTNLNGCWITFEESMEPLTKCANLESYIQCYSNIFYKNCNLESGWWSCEYIKANISSLYPQCYTSCTFS
uniref:BPTI/Kunitz inhibitor domain-containing protein n=1 Tax=Strongyloides papillosus TaxID=174720 RepID=A0A0N5C5N5_STREA